MCICMSIMTVRCKLAGLRLRAGDAAEAYEAWASAEAVLRCLVDPLDPDLAEAQEMLKQLAQALTVT